MILFIVTALILLWVDMIWYKEEGKHISLIFPIILLSLILPLWMTFPILVIYLIKKVIEWKH